MRDRAVALASQGRRVFKLRVNSKLPAAEGWRMAATDDASTAYGVWTCPATGESLDNNIGVATGAGLMVVDVDVSGDKQGAMSLDLLRDLGLDTKTLTVKTSTGGQHLYFELPPGVAVPNSASKLGPGIDVRGEGGFVVGAGSTIGGVPYEQLPEAAVQRAPKFLVEMCGRAASTNKQSADIAPLVELDEPDCIRRAIEWLEQRAPKAITGQGGDTATFRIACRVKDFGISEAQCAELMRDHWNEDKARPIWDPGELADKVANAYRYGASPPGIASAAADFEVVTLARPQNASPATAEWPTPTPLEPFDIDSFPAREWIVPSLFARTFVTGIVSPGGMGKTQLIAAACLAVASGNDKPLGMNILDRTKVWYWNQEDDGNELRRRVGAAMKHFGLGWADLKRDGEQMLFLDSGVEKPLTLARRLADGNLSATKQVDQIVQGLRQRGIGLFVIDPMSEFHEAGENDNPEMRMVWGLARRIAVQANCAVAVAAHSRKPPQAATDGFAGSADALRGASSQIGVLRLAFTMYGMSVKDAKTWGVTDAERHLYVRLDGAKSNLSLIDGKPRWFKRMSATVGGESVGVLAPVMLAERGSGVDILHIIAKTIDGCEDWEPGVYHSLAEIVQAAEESERAAFGDRAHHSREIGKACEAHGLDLTGDPPQGQTLTDYGMLHIVSKRGRAGTQFRLQTP